MSWLGHVLGLDDPTGPIYLAWSGFGADLGELALLAGLYQWARRHNCHVHGCWRIGRHRVGDTGIVVCRRHHPHGAPTAVDVARSLR
jgi:hypothetical protein